MHAMDDSGESVKSLRQPSAPASPVSSSSTIGSLRYFTMQPTHVGDPWDSSAARRQQYIPLRWRGQLRGIACIGINPSSSSAVWARKALDGLLTYPVIHRACSISHLCPQMQHGLQIAGRVGLGYLSDAERSRDG